MGTLTGQSIADASWATLGDSVGVDGVRWPEAEVLRYINDGQRETVLNLPSSFVKTAIVSTVSGTRQTLVGSSIVDGIQLIKMTRNFNSAGTVPGRAVTPRPVSWLDNERPDWHSDASGDAAHYFFDPADPKAWYVWPPSSGSIKAEIVYSATPPDLASLASVISIDDIYSNALQYFVLFRAMTKQANYTKNPMATMFYQLFLQSLGVKDARVKALDANQYMAADVPQGATK